MHDIEAILLSVIIVATVFADIIRFPLLKQDRGSRFFVELLIGYSLYLGIAGLVLFAEQQILSYPQWLERLLWIVHFLSMPCLLAMWMHFNALNVMPDEQLVNRLTLVHILPLLVLVVLAAADIPKQRFYPVTEGYVHLMPSAGTYFFLILSGFFCLAMLLPTLGHRSELPGSLLFISVLMPIVFTISLSMLAMRKSSMLFTMVNTFMLVLQYVVGQRDSIRTDALTGLPAYPLLQRKLIRIFNFRAQYTIVLLDIENLSYFNVRHGTTMGDALLVAFSEFLKTLVHVNEVFRFSDDQFCLCVPQNHSPRIDTLVQHVRSRLEQPWTLGQEHVYIQVNMAMVSIPGDASSLSELVQVMKQLAFDIKTTHGRSMFVYTRQSSIEHQHTMNILSALRDSVRKPEQVCVYYQPIIEVSSGKLVAAEALMRIEDANLGFLQPSQFIPLAEQSNLIIPLTRILFSKVCRFVKQAEETIGHPLHVSVNLSGKEFSSKRLAKTLLEHMEAEKVDPAHISFEITESVVLHSYEAVAEMMHELSKQKIEFSLDDFGSGYSNLQALMKLPYTYVKFDKSVLEGAQTNPTMLRLLTVMLHELGKCIVAEGVETEEELALVRSMGIERVQGFYYSKPVSQDVLMDSLSSKTWW
ncbi:MAG: bifunctional diguanylate cyclase/phosphodiesterase [Sphaerochaeta sp.]|nr:bifunctional diguanylate cyclase/phosphodiesterase [Sphaerochaeta sp.]MDD3930039.1 bifunctional diguanylate cyclase/phosphodiesterase [Sphaerochaeta sp.]